MSPFPDGIALTMTPSKEAPEENSKQSSFKHWDYFRKKPSIARDKVKERYAVGACIGCGKSPCECKNRKRGRKPSPR